MTYSVSPWSFSKIKAFEQCPKQFYHMKITKEYQDKETEAMVYGTLFHEAAENFMRDDTPIPKKFDFVEDALTRLKNMPGEKLCEYKLGVTENLEPCEFFADDVWFRGIADLIIINDDTAWVVDYKTGKSARYADTGQLELMALATFKHFPQVKKVNAGLLFVIAKALVKDSYQSATAPALWKKWLTNYARMEKALATGVWNPRPSGLCRQHCAVLECPHNGRN
jgi:CRISPR/Cas system-associated exonuclease Cas4 (RecB family)